MTTKQEAGPLRAEKPPRRGFLLKLWLGLGCLASAEMLWMVFSFLKPRPAPPRSGTVVTAGHADEFNPNSVTAFPRGHFYLVRLEDGGFLALSRRCPHLGCTVPWVDGENRFVCPCHASVFDISGAVIQAPAPRALDLFAVRIENQIVRVDTGRPLKRSGFQKDQAVYLKTA